MIVAEDIANRNTARTYSGFFLGFTGGSTNRVFVAIKCTARQRPRATTMSPRCAKLQQHSWFIEVGAHEK
jgi:hypothetical protein